MVCRSNLIWIALRCNYSFLIMFIASLSSAVLWLDAAKNKPPEKQTVLLLLILLLLLLTNDCATIEFTPLTGWMCHCRSSAVVPHLTVPLIPLSSAMHVTPGLLLVRRCWWDGSLTGPAAALDMLLICNAQLWQRNQRCLYAKPAAPKTWWEIRKCHTLSLPHWHTLDALTVS